MEWLEDSWIRGGRRRWAPPIAGEWSLTTAELRVLQFLPTHLSFPEIARAAERLGEHRQDPHPRRLPQARRVFARARRSRSARGAGLIDADTLASA